MNNLIGCAIIAAAVVVGAIILGNADKKPNSTHEFVNMVYDAGQSLSVAKGSQVQIFDDYVLFIDATSGEKMFMPMEQIKSITLK